MANRSQNKKLQAMGCTVQVHPDHVSVFWPTHALHIHGATITEAIAQMEAAQAIKAAVEGATFHHSPDNVRMVNVEFQGEWLSDGYKTPHELFTMMQEGRGFASTFKPSELMEGEPNPEAEPTVERVEGIPANGGVAFKEGIASADCPYDSEENYDEFERWNREWDEAADEKEDEEDKPSGSVVKDKYRAIYAERGHPAHCGDWLADILNNLVIANGQTDIERFESICEANGVNMSKYKRTGNGWQGRFRMTGRNMLARKLFSAEFLLAPDMNGEIQRYPVPQEWKDQQRFAKAA
jgi:hypothetical protein